MYSGHSQKISLDDLFQNSIRKVELAADRISSDALPTANVDKWVESLVNEYKINLLSIDQKGVTFKPRQEHLGLGQLPNHFMVPLNEKVPIDFADYDVPINGGNNDLIKLLISNMGQKVAWKASVSNGYRLLLEYTFWDVFTEESSSNIKPLFLKDFSALQVAVGDLNSRIAIGNEKLKSETRAYIQNKVNKAITRKKIEDGLNPFD